MREVKNRVDLAKLFCELGFTIGAEIGVFKGWYSRELLGRNPNLFLYCVDPWQRKNERVFEIAKQKLANYNAKLIRKTSAEALKDIADSSLDFVYIDGEHDYKNVRHDVFGWSKKVRTGGIVSGHDYFTHTAGVEFGVIRAVDEYVKENDQQLFITKEEFAPSWLFYKG
jgi:predicted O-methyltransferase YrrM